jgi:hypothetical protein
MPDGFGSARNRALRCRFVSIPPNAPPTGVDGFIIIIRNVHSTGTAHWVDATRSLILSRCWSFCAPRSARALASALLIEMERHPITEANQKTVVEEVARTGYHLVRT